MRNRNYWNVKRIYFLLVSLCLMFFLIGSLRGQMVAIKVINLSRQHQENVYTLNDQISAVSKELDQAQDGARRDELLLFRLDLESQRLDSQLERINTTIDRAGLNASESHRLLFGLVLVGFFWSVYHGLLRNDY